MGWRRVSGFEVFDSLSFDDDDDDDDASVTTLELEYKRRWGAI